MWMVRSPSGQYADALLSKGIVAIGWEDAGSRLSTARKPEDFYQIVRETWPESKPQQVVNSGRQLYKFFREMKAGDDVATYDSSRRFYHLGVIAGDARHDPAAGIETLANVRPVKWESQVSRDRLTQATRDSLGSTLTVFQPSSDAIGELKQLAKAAPSESTSETPLAHANVEVEDPLVSAQENSRELVKDKLATLTWQEMQALVAGILRAMGYKTRISPDGRDRGKDIIASPDALGLEHPRIFVEVKHRKEQMGAPDVRKFIGGRDPTNDRCVYVSIGGFTTEAKYEAERSRVPLTLVDSDELVDLLLTYYEATDAEVRALIPLKKTWWPA